MPQSMLVGLTSVEIHLSPRHAGGVLMVDDLLNELHLLTCCSGCQTDFGADHFKYFRCSHEERQVFGPLHEVYIELL